MRARVPDEPGQAMALEGCAAVSEATQGCGTVVLAATDLEAAPVLAALAHPIRYRLAGKTVHVGEIAVAHAEGARRAQSDPPAVRVVLAVSGCDKVNTAVTLTCLLQGMAVRPGLVLQTGIAGAFAGTCAGDAVQSILPGDVVIATQESYSDTGSTSPCGWIAAAELGLPIAEVNGVELGGVFAMDLGLVEWAAGVLTAVGLSGAGAGVEATGRAGNTGHAAVTGGIPTVWQGPCVTSSTVTGRDDEARLVEERWGALAESMEGAAAAHVCALYGVPFLEVRGISNLVGDRDRQSWQVEDAVAAAGRAALALVAARETSEAGE